MNRKTRKLAEAKYFYDRMVEVQTTVIQHNRDHFTYNFSAFLSASRSVIQYMYREIEQKQDPVAKKWYKERMAASPNVRFFKGKRNDNIHVTPIMPIGHIVAVVPGPVTFRYSFSARQKPDKEVLPLCRAYLAEIEEFINEGISKGYITL